MPKRCPDCGVKPGQHHAPGCDVAICPRCGGQRIGCNCIYEVCGMDVDTLEQDHPAIYAEGPTAEMYARWDAEWGKRDQPWTGEWPGVAECRELGWYSRMTPDGWQQCRKDEPGAGPDLNRLFRGECVWDVENQRWRKREEPTPCLNCPSPGPPKRPPPSWPN